ncbi:hypothetical protein [Halalkalibacterium ligniniphilum]|uniref:hypothetical protein n=1 Tax=Halalkalibacterium ligniniphilum TaxID=1134413 RepID=UPI00034BB9E6|nr:hypothetical protein [Halalkalibacterium ligniniphilum]
MSVMKELYLVTKELDDHLHGHFPKEEDERDLFIEKLNEGLESRDALIKAIERDKLTEKEQALGGEVVKLNERINERLELLIEVIRTDMNQLKVRKNIGRRYEHPYEGPTVDGVFFDKRGV